MTNAELIACIKENQVLKKLKALQDHLRLNAISADGPDESRPQDPCLWVRGLSKHFVLQIIIPPKAGNSITVNLRPVSENSHSPTKAEREAFEQFVTVSGRATRNDGAYCQLERRIPLDDPGQVVVLVGQARRLK